MPRQLAEVPPIPEELEYLWEWWKLEAFSGEALTWAELDAWARVTRKDMAGWEASVVMSLDNIYWRVKQET